MLEKIKNNKGQALIETMVALSVISVGLLGIFALLSSSLGFNRLVSERHIATYLAAEGIELVKNLIDTNVINDKSWNSNIGQGDYEIDYHDTALSSWNDKFLLYDVAGGFYGYVSGVETKYKRKITIKALDAEFDQMQVNSIVRWAGRGGAEFEVNLEDRFYNWRPE